MASKKRSVSLSLPAAARKSKKSAKQAHNAENPRENEHDQADMEILAALMDAPPGAVINITDTEPQPPTRTEAIDDRHGLHSCDEVSNMLAAAATTSVGNGALPRHPVSTDEAGHLAAAAAGAATGAAETHLHEDQREMAVTGVSEPTLAMTTARSLTIQCTGKRSRRACSSKAQQLLQQMDGRDDEGATPSPDDKAAGRQKKRTKRDEDSDFEVDGPGSSSDSGSDDAADEDDEDFGLDEEEDTPKKAKKKSKLGQLKSKHSAQVETAAGKGSRKASARAHASTGSAANTGGAGAGSGCGSVKASSQRTSLASAMPSGGRRRPSMGGKAAASIGDMHAPAARAVPQAAADGVAGAISGSSCAVGGSGRRVLTSGAAAVRGSAKANSAKTDMMEQGHRHNVLPVATAEGQVGVHSDVDGSDKENSGTDGRLMEANAATAVSSIGMRPAASAISRKGPGLSRGVRSHVTGSPGSSAPAGGLKILQHSAAPAASGVVSSKDGANKRTAADAAATSSGQSMGGLGSVMGWGSQLTGMFGGAAYRVAGLRRPARK